MADVISFPGVTKLDLDPERVLRKAMEAGVTEVVIVGFDKGGNDYFASSVADAGNVIYHLRRAEHRLMRLIDDETE
jgi:hypothetical protein